jgi:hypothetical protein
MRPRFPDLPKRSRIVRQDPTADEANFSNDISFGCQWENSPSADPSPPLSPETPLELDPSSLSNRDTCGVFHKLRSQIQSASTPAHFEEPGRGRHSLPAGMLQNPTAIFSLQ